MLMVLGSKLGLVEQLVGLHPQRNCPNDQASRRKSAVERMERVNALNCLNVLERLTGVQLLERFGGTHVPSEVAIVLSGLRSVFALGGGFLTGERPGVRGNPVSQGRKDYDSDRGPDGTCTHSPAGLSQGGDRRVARHPSGLLGHWRQRNTGCVTASGVGQRADLVIPATRVR